MRTRRRLRSSVAFADGVKLSLLRESRCFSLVWALVLTCGRNRIFTRKIAISISSRFPSGFRARGNVVAQHQDNGFSSFPASSHSLADFSPPNRRCLFGHEKKRENDGTPLDLRFTDNTLDPSGYSNERGAANTTVRKQKKPRGKRT